MEAKRTSAGDRRASYGKAPLELDFTQAVEAIDRISKEGRVIPAPNLAFLLGNTITSSAFTRKVRALSSYGLVDLQSDGSFSLTELALAIALPKSMQSQMIAKQEAFLKIYTFNLLFQQHKGKLLPADEFIRNILEQDAAIPRELSQEWAKHFKAGAREAGLLHARADGKTQISESPVIEASAPIQEISEALDKSAREEPVMRGYIPTLPVRPADDVQLRQLDTSGHYTRIDLSDGRRAEIRIPDRLSARDAQKLQKALDGVRLIIESMILED